MERKNAIKFLQGWGIVTVALVLAFPLILTPLVNAVDIPVAIFDAAMIGGFVGWSIYTVKAIQAINTVLKSKKPTNESINPTNPNDDNQKVLDNIQNVLSTSDDNSALQKIEELKRQLEILEQSIKNNDTNSETESPKLSEEELKELKDSQQKKTESVMTVLMISLLIFIIIASFIAAITSGNI
jgi:hypothetical protein